MVSIPACHAGDRGSIPRRGAIIIFFRSRIVVLDNIQRSSNVDFTTFLQLVCNSFVCANGYLPKQWLQHQTKELYTLFT